MTSNSNLELLMEKIFDDEEIVDQIMATDDMFELYALCQKVQDGYTFEEFTEFFEGLIYVCLDEAERVKTALEENSDKINELEEKDLNKISGGVRGAHKLTSSVLASIMLLTSTGASATGNTSSAMDASVVKLRDVAEEKAKQKAEEGNKFLKWLSKSLDTVWDNKGKIFISSLMLIASGVFLTKDKNKIVENIRELVRKKEDSKRWKHELDVLGSDKRPEDFRAENYSHLSDEEQKKIREKIDADQRLWDEYHPKELEGNNTSTGQPYTDQEKAFYKETVLKTRNEQMTSLRAQIESNEKDGILGTLSNNLVLAGAVTSLLGGAGTALKEVTDFINRVAQVGENIQTIQNQVDRGQKTILSWQQKVTIEAQKQLTKDFDSVAAEAELREDFEKSIHGQERAKEQIMELFTQFTADKIACKMGIYKKNLPDQRIIIFNGQSGTGKTLTALRLSKALTNIDPYVITANDILQASKSSFVDMSYAFLYGNTKQGGDKRDDMANLNTSSLESFLRWTQGTVRVVIVDEVDKLFMKDPNRGYPDVHPLEETVRDILAGRLNDIYGHNIDLSGTVFIFTTNETTASLKGRIKVDHRTGNLVEQVFDEDGSPAKDQYGHNVYMEPVRDDTGTQTVVPHDGSLMARLAGSICLFDQLKEEDYESIARGALGDDRSIKSSEDNQEAGSPDKVILKERLLRELDGVIISDKGYKFIAKYASEMRNGARAIVGEGGTKVGTVAGNLSTNIENYIAFLTKMGKSYRDLTLLAEPYETKDSTGRRIIKFNIEALGYDGYDKYLKEYKDK